MPLHVTLLYGGLSALLLTGLGVYVSLLRISTRTLMGREPPKQLIRPIRAHGNAAEWIPLGIVLLAILELSHVSSLSLHVLGGTLLGARVLHAVGALGKNHATTIGATLNYLVLGAMAGWALVLHF